MTTNESVVVKTVAPNHFCLDQNVNPRLVRTIATSLPVSYTHLTLPTIYSV